MIELLKLGKYDLANEYYEKLKKVKGENSITVKYKAHILLGQG